MGNQAEENKRKQRFLLRNGVNVKVDGSWGPWQQAQYEKLTTKEKPYQTTPLGLLSFAFDKLTGNSTYQEDPPEVKGYDGEIKSDDRSNTRRWIDQQMSNNKTPLGYVTQTVLPAGAVAAAVTYGAPVLYNAVTKGAPFIYNGVRTAASNPVTITPALKTGAQAGLQLGKQFGKELVKGVAGMEVVNAATKAATGKTWGEQVSQSTGVSPEFGEILNPGVGLGSRAYNIGKNLYSQGPKYIFDNLPYKTLYNIQNTASSIGQDAITFLKTPINKNPIKAIKNRHESLQVGKTPRTDIQYDNSTYYNTHNVSVQNINDPIYQIRKRLHNRMNREDYTYSYPNDGFVVYMDKNMYDPDYIISQIPVKDYLSFKDVYRLGINKGSGLSDKVLSAIRTPGRYLRYNTNPAYAWLGDSRFIKVNKKALKDFGFDYSTTLSHEYNHALRNNNRIDDRIGNVLRPLGFNYKHLRPSIRKYLSDATEIEARGTQLKNYFNSDVITPDMLKYAAKHYVNDTDMDNNMYQFFSGIKDWDAAAKYLSEFSLKNGGKLLIQKNG